MVLRTDSPYSLALLARIWWPQRTKPREVASPQVTAFEPHSRHRSPARGTLDQQSPGSSPGGATARPGSTVSACRAFPFSVAQTRSCFVAVGDTTEQVAVEQAVISWGWRDRSASWVLQATVEELPTTSRG